MTYKLIEHRLGDGGSVTEGKGYGVVPNPLQILQSNEPIPPAYRDISTIIYWHKFARNLGYDCLFIRDRIIEAAIKELPLVAVYNSSNDVVEPLEEGLTILVGLHPRDDFEGHSTQFAIYFREIGWQFYNAIDYAYQLANNVEKEILARLNIGSINHRLLDFPSQDIYDWAGEYHSGAIACRTERIRWLATYFAAEIPHGLSPVMAAIFLSPVGNLYWLYTEAGVFGTIEDRRPMPGILDYFLGRSLFKDKGLTSLKVIPASSHLTLEQIATNAYNYLYLGVKPIAS
jgi:hypothetical protein